MPGCDSLKPCSVLDSKILFVGGRGAGFLLADDAWHVWVCRFSDGLFNSLAIFTSFTFQDREGDVAFGRGQVLRLSPSTSKVVSFSFQVLWL